MESREAVTHPGVFLQAKLLLKATPTPRFGQAIVKKVVGVLYKGKLRKSLNIRSVSEKVWMEPPEGSAVTTVEYATSKMCDGCLTESKAPFHLKNNPIYL